MLVLSTCRVSCRSTAAEERTSLIPETLQELSLDKEQQALNERLQVEGQAALSKEERRRRQRSLDSIGAPSFQHILKARIFSLLPHVQALLICIMRSSCQQCSTYVTSSASKHKPRHRGAPPEHELLSACALFQELLWSNNVSGQCIARIVASTGAVMQDCPKP